MRVAGLDLSMSATGVAAPNGILTTWRPTVDGDARLVELAGRAEQLVQVEQPDLVVIEDLPFNARAAGVVGMVHGVVRCALARRTIAVVLVPPATLKMYATGRGNATKPDMRVELFKRAGVDERDDNRVDAWWLRAIGLDSVGAPVLELPKDHRRALDKITWPVGAVA